MADQGVEPHEVVHVGVGHEDGVEGFEDPFCQVVELAAVHEDGPPQGTDVHQEDRVVQESRAEGGLQVAEGEAVFHGGAP